MDVCFANDTPYASFSEVAFSEDSRCQLPVGKAPSLAASVARTSLRWLLGAEPYFMSTPAMGDGRARDAGDPSTYPDGEVDLELQTTASSKIAVNPSGGESGTSGLSQAMAEMQISDEPPNMDDQHDHFATIAAPTQNLAADTCEELPSFVENSAAIEGQWGKISTSTFASKVNEYYDIAIHWKRNAFDIPRENAVKVLTEELTKLLDMFNEKKIDARISNKSFPFADSFRLAETFQRF